MLNLSFSRMKVGLVLVVGVLLGYCCLYLLLNQEEKKVLCPDLTALNPPRIEWDRANLTTTDLAPTLPTETTTPDPTPSNPTTIPTAPTNRNPNCRFYATNYASSIFPQEDFTYPRSVFYSHLIDLVFQQNKEQNLVNGEGWKRTNDILKTCKQNGIVLFSSKDPLFHPTMEYVASWFRGYGCPTVETFTTDVEKEKIGNKAWSAIGIFVPTEGVPFDNLIIIQTEQMTAMSWVNRLRPALMACNGNAKCAIWEFSESNYVHSIENYGTQLPTIILPVTLRSRSVPGKVTPLNERKNGFIFYGWGNDRRNRIVEDLKQALNRWDSPQTEAAYGDAKFCVSVHFYAADSGIELHRLAQHVKMGCLPVYETPGDPMAVRFFQHHETLLFEKYEQFVQKVFTINDCIQSDLEYMLEQQMFVAEWWSRELELFEKVLKAFFYEYF